MIDYSKITDNETVINLLKLKEDIELEIKKLDDMALVRYELERLNN